MKKAHEMVEVDMRGIPRDIVERVKARGYSDEEIALVVRTSSSLEQAVRVLTLIGAKHETKKPRRAPEHDDSLDPHDQEVFERIASGEFQPEVIVGD
jgi:hypothetical protein